MQVYRAEWRMPCAVKKMKGRISKEQMTEFVREVLPLSLLDVACMHARSCACMHGSRGKWGPCLHGSKRSLSKGACHHAMPPHAAACWHRASLPCLALVAAILQTHNAHSERTATYEDTLPTWQAKR